MGKTLAKKIRGMGLRTKVGIVFILLMGSFLYQGILKPLIGVTATNTYYFRTDSSSVRIGVDGSTTTSTSTTPNKKISLIKGTPYTSSRSVIALANLTNQTLLRAYGPAYASKQTLTAPAVTIGVRDRNGTTGAINWTAEIYDYNPAGTLNNGVLLWTSDVKEAHPSVQTPLELTFSGDNTLPKIIEPGHRIKVVIKCQMANTSSSARLYWGSSSNYSFFTVSESPYVANSVTVDNLADYYGGSLTTVTQGDSNIPMLKLDMYTNAGAGVSWTGGKLDKIGTNTTVYQSLDEPGDVTFSIYKDAGGAAADGLFKTSDTKIGGPYRFDDLVGQTYALDTAQTITTTPVRYFVVYNILRTAVYNTTVGARIPNSTYFTVTGATTPVVNPNLTTTSSSTPNIQFGGTAVTKSYPADWDAGTSLAGISESAGPNITDSTCIVRNTAGSGFPLVGLLNYPASSCRSVAGQGYSTATAQADFARLYFGGAGYPSAMKTIKGNSFVYRVYTPSGGGTVTLQLFYVTSSGVRVNAPITSRYTTTNSVSQTITTSLAGQNFSDLPAGARLGIQIGVTANMRIGLGSSVNARLTVQETAAENENVDVGNGTAIANASVYASAVGKVINSFTLSAAKAKTVNSITVKGSPMFTSQNVKEVSIYADSATAGTLGVRDGTDTLVGSTNTISNGEAVISGFSLAVSTKVTRYLVVVDIGNTPNTNVILTALVSDLAVATTGGLGVNSDSSSATITILPTTTLKNFKTAEPPSITISSSAGPTKVDAFSLETNGGINDTITSMTVSLSTDSTLPAGKVISDYVGRVDIVTGAGVSLGHLTAPTMADNWQIATLGLAANMTPTEYYVSITPKGNQNITFRVKGRVTELSHFRSSNELLKNDSDSAVLLMDQHPPTEPVLTATTGSYDDLLNRAEIDLDWAPGSTDASLAPVTYKLVRGLGNAPPPRSCSVDGVKSFLVHEGPETAVTDNAAALYEGVSYGYRVCSVDSVYNTSVGSAKTASASIKSRCDQMPLLKIDPMNAHLNAGTTSSMSVGIVNKDTGVCEDTTFALQIVGIDVDDTNFAVSHFDDPSSIIATNNGSKYTHLHVTAKPGAAQKAVRTFHVKVVKSTGGEVLCPDPIHVVVNKYGSMLHSSMQLGTAKFGSWGIDYNCSTCHSPTATNIKQVKNVIGTPNGNRPVSFSITSTSSNASVAGVFGNDLRSGTASTNICEVCHHQARFHQYSASKVAWKEHNNNTDCMKCHPHSRGFKTIDNVGSCENCHGNPPVIQAELVLPPTDVLFPYGSNAGSHEKHNNRQVECATCHSNGNHLGTSIPDKKLDIGFSIRSSHFKGFVGEIASGTLRTLAPGNDYAYQNAAGTVIQQAPSAIMTCNVYCHGWEESGGYNSEPAWTGITQVGCGSCHAASNELPPDSGSHRKHASREPGYGNGIACSQCHGFRNYSTSSSHINGSVEWDLSTITAGSQYRGLSKGSTGTKAPTAAGSYGSCTNLYCHSTVVSIANNNGTGAPDSGGYTTPTWGGSTTCNSCHQAEPNMTGGHPQHAGAGEAGFDCRICHSNGGSTNSLNHANGKINFSFAGLGENTQYSYGSDKTPGSAYGTCSSSNCHGRRNTAWAPLNPAIPLCEKCHATDPSAAGFYGTAGPGTRSNTDPYVGAHFQHITSMPYKYSAKIACSSCHITPTGPYSPGHIDSALPAEITFGSLAASGLQGTFTSAAHLPTYDSGSRTCNSLWCHGGGMDSNEGTGPYGSIGPIGDGFDGGALGTPAPAVWNSPFLTGVGTNDCIKCHSFPPAAPESGYTHWDDTNERPYIANQCVLCHKHVDNSGYAFKNPKLHVNGLVDSCNTCHGRPPIDEKSMTVPAVGALSPGMVGAHQAHSLNPSIKNNCNVCHDAYSQEMPSYFMEIGFNAYGGKVTSGTFYGYSTLPSMEPLPDPPNYSSEIIFKSTNAGTTVRRTTDKAVLNTCANLYCHGGGTPTLTALGGGSNTKPNWEGGSSQAECGSCHGVTGDTYNVSGSHGAHVGTGFGKPRLACANCHGIKENNYHVDGQVEWHFYSTALRLNEKVTDPEYTPAAGNGTAGAVGKTNNLAPSASFGTCAVYCHSDGKGAYSNPLPVWGGGPLEKGCGSCHIDQTSTFSGSHENHSKSSALGGYGIDCLICHNGSGSGSPMHVNGSIDVIFNTAVVGASATWNSGGKSCFNILCHDTTDSAGPTWNVPSTGNYETGTHKPTCIGCHSGEVGARAAVVPQFAGESHHVQGAAISNTVCHQCHMEAAADGKVSSATYHDRTAGKPVDLVIWGAGARGTAYTSYLASGGRSEYAKINNHCIGCHSTKNNNTQPFSTAGDTRTPKAYSWDTGSIFSRYSGGTTDTVKWSQYSTAFTSPKSKNKKAYSAHGRADLNQRGWAYGTDTTGENYTNTSGAVKVLCYDCHNSHGTTAGGIMSSYSSATGRYKGAILKSTVQGIGGYGATYTPTEGGDAAAPNKNAYNTGAALCFDCHNNKTPNSTMPWGYGGTFNSNQPIYGYNDKPYFGNYSSFASTVTYSKYKGGNPHNKGGHFGAYSTMSTNPAKPIRGLCTPCHDPHGVSPSLGADRQYALPLLKGTWVTSPYKQDAAPRNINENRGGSTKSGKQAVKAVGSTPQYSIDQNNLQAANSPTRPATARSWTFATNAKTSLQTRTATQFAGLCLGCHAEGDLKNTAAASTANWKTMKRIHNTVSGWATTGGGNASNNVHAFTCSKCHSAHNSKLPRLLVTNCLDVKHRGQAASGGAMATVQRGASSNGSGAGRFPQGGGGAEGKNPTNASERAANPGPWFFGKMSGTLATNDENKTNNTITLTSQTKCHQTATAGGAAPGDGSPYSSGADQQLWNNVTPW